MTHVSSWTRDEDPGLPGSAADAVGLRRPGADGVLTSRGWARARSQSALGPGAAPC